MKNHYEKLSISGHKINISLLNDTNLKFSYTLVLSPANALVANNTSSIQIYIVLICVYIYSCIKNIYSLVRCYITHNLVFQTNYRL